MKVKSGFLILLCVSLLCVLCSCTKKPVVYTYEDLSQEQKIIIDGVMGEFDNWKSLKGVDCIGAGFNDENGELVFAVYYSDKKPEYSNLGSSQIGSYCIFRVDKSNGKLSPHHYSIYDQLLEWSTMDQAHNNFPVDAPIQEQKNKLSDNLYRVLQETNTK